VGIEFKYMNGKDARFATTQITNSLFVGRMIGEIAGPEDYKCSVLGNCQGPRPGGSESTGIFYGGQTDANNGWTYAINLPGIGSEVSVSNSSAYNYEGMVYSSSWVVPHRGGYEMAFWNMTLHNVNHIVHHRNQLGGIVIDGDGSMTGHVGAHIVPPTGQFRNNPFCQIGGDGRYFVCDTPVRQIHLLMDKVTAPYWNMADKNLYPLAILTDITDEELTGDWDAYRRDPSETRMACEGGGSGCSPRHTSTAQGPNSCFAQAPGAGWSLLVNVGRKYLLTWYDAYFMRVTADVNIR